MALPPTAREQRWLAVLLAFAGGWVDAVGYMVLFHVFTAHMSGNSIALTVHLGEESWGQAFHRAFPIPMFVLGVAAGAALNELLSRRAVRPRFSVIFALEALLLLLFILLGSAVFRNGSIAREPGWRFYALMALPALAIGLQNATMRRVAGKGVRTTYISGVLTDLAEGVVHRLAWRPTRKTGVRPSGKRLVFLGSVWVGYVLGGFLGAVTKLRWELFCLLVPVGCLLVMIGLDLTWPLAPRTAAEILRGHP